MEFKRVRMKFTYSFIIEDNIENVQPIPKLTLDADSCTLLFLCALSLVSVDFS